MWRRPRRAAALQSIQPEYNLINRADLEGPLLDLCRAEGLGVIPYYGLASGFLSGLYRTAEDVRGQDPQARLESYMTPRGLRILDALADVAARHRANSAQVALAWVAAQPGLTGPIASATSVRAQVADLAAAARWCCCPRIWRILMLPRTGRG
jgi:aryl-alcohol dehydrogenase-like predicted oxidoreductase